MIPGLDTVLVGEVEEHTLAVPLHTIHIPAPTEPFSISEYGYAYILGCSD